MNSALNARLKKIKLFVMDVDGVLTDGKIVVDAQGKELKFFDVQDGFGLVLLRQTEIKTAILSARSSSATAWTGRPAGVVSGAITRLLRAGSCSTPTAWRRRCR